jgi:hypothetical protein
LRSSRFHESPTRSLHGHMRCVPAPQDVLCSADVGGVAVSAFNAAEDCLAFAAPGINDIARRASLRGLGRIDPTATFLRLVGEFVGEAIPTLGEDVSVEAKLPTQVAARLIDGHVGDLEILEHDRPEASGYVDRHTVLPILTNAGDLSRFTRDATKLLDPALGSRLTTGQDPLSARLVAIEDLTALRDRHPLLGRERQGVDNAAIDTDCGADVDRDLVLDRTRDADVPTRVTQRNRGVLNVTPRRAGLADPDPADLGRSHLGPPGIEAAPLDLPPLEPKRIVAALTTRRGVLGAVLEEVVERRIEIRLLLACLGDGSDPIELSPQDRQLSALSRIAEPRPGMAMVLPPPDRALFEGEIIDLAADDCERPELPILLGCRRELVAQAAIKNQSVSTLSGCIGSGVKNESDAGTLDSFAVCAPSLNNKQGRARFLPGLKTGACARDSR